MNDEHIPPPPDFSEESKPFTARDAESDPVLKEHAEAARQSKEAIQALIDRVRQDRILDRPIEFIVGGKTYQFTSRPIGWIDFMLEELSTLSGIFDNLRNELLNNVTEGGASAVTGSDPLTDSDMRALFLKQGKEGRKVITRIARLLLEPVDKDNPQPPNMNELTLSENDATWGMTLKQYTDLLNAFLVRDLMQFGGPLKKVLGITQLGQAL